jgi:hypothetical protein
MGFAEASPDPAVRAKFSTEPYVASPDMAQSMSLVARKIREGYQEALNDPHQALRGWVGQALMAAGKPIGIRARVQAILDAYSAKTLYGPDPHNAELVQSAVASLCLKPGLCLPLNDCDDKTVGGATCILIAGIPCWTVRQNYGGGAQQHVLIGFKDDSGRKVLVDFSNGQIDCRQVSDETWVDPIAGMTPMTIGVGAPCAWAYETRDGRLWASSNGGESWIEVQDPLGFGAPDASVPYVPVQGFALKAGFRYRVQMLFTPDDFYGTGTVSETAQYLADQYGRDWLVESIGPDGDRTPGAVTGGVVSWTLQGIPKHDLVLASEQRYLNPSYTNISVQATSDPAAVTPAPQPGGPTPPGSNTIGAGTVLVASALTAVGGGLALAWYRKQNTRQARSKRRLRR